MGYNICDNPEKFGLEIVTALEFSDRCYCFDTLLVWKNNQNQLLWAQDSGCSCPTPFEDVGVNDLKLLETYEQAEEISKNESWDEYCKDKENNYYSGNSNFGLDRMDFLDKVRKYL